MADTRTPEAKLDAKRAGKTARIPIKVVAASVYVCGPAEVAAGAKVQVAASGPVDTRHWLGFAPCRSSQFTRRG